VLSASTGETERTVLGDFSSVAPDGKTLAYFDTTGVKLLSLETGEVRGLVSNPASAPYGVIGWNPGGSKIYLQASEGNTTEVWNLGTLKLEKTLPQTSGYGWNSLGAPVDTGVTSYAQYEDCSLKILDLTTLRTIRTLDETAIDPLEIKLSLKATYLTEYEYGIGGTASVAGTTFKVRGLGNAGTRGRLVAQTPADMPMSASLELLDANGAVAWSVPNIGGYNFGQSQYGQSTFNGFITNLTTRYSPYDLDGFNFKLTPAP
jgi:WD40 repeat protein